MRPIVRLVSICALGMMLVAQATPAGAVRLREYRGRTSQDKGMYLDVEGQGTGLRLRGYGFRFDTDCEDGSRLRWRLFVSFGGSGYPFQADLSFEYGSETLGLSFTATGIVGPHDADGTFTASTGSEGGPVCATGELTWSAHKRDFVSRTSPASAEGEGQIRLRIGAAGTGYVVRVGPGSSGVLPRQ